MKLYVKSAKEISKSYDNVSKVLNKLFGFDYSKYKKESDWFKTKKFGTVKYQVISAMGDNSSYRIAVIFNGDDSKDNFYKFLRYCNDNDIHVSSQYPHGSDRYHPTWDTDLPQINIKVPKGNLYTEEEANTILNIVKEYYSDVRKREEWDNLTVYIPFGREIDEESRKLIESQIKSRIPNATKCYIAHYYVRVWFRKLR